MKPILTVDRLKEVLHYDSETGVFQWRINSRGHRKAGEVAGHTNPNGYRQIIIDQRNYYSHRLAWFYVTGKWPSEEIDHINREKSDDRFSNLREASPHQNKCNTTLSTRNTSGVKGVHFRIDRQKWQGHIGYHGKKKNLGYFDTLEDAKEFRCLAADMVHGGFVHHVG